MKNSRVCVMSLIFIILCYAIEIKKATREPLPVLRGDELIPVRIIPYVDGPQPPGTQIGTTTYEHQANGSFGQRLTLDDLSQIHVNWMYCGGEYPGNPRYIVWNFRDKDGVWFGETQAAPSISGYCQLDVTRDADPDSQRTVIAYHHSTGYYYYSWIDIDSVNGSGNWPNDPKTPGYDGYIWPYIAAVNNGNIVMATHDQYSDSNIIRLCVTTDKGDTWTLIADFDSCSTISQFVRSSINPGSNKVVFAHTQFITDTFAQGYMDNDVYYMLSTDGGVTWGPHTNITNYQPYPIDSVRAYTDVNAIFDSNDNLHIVWTGRKVTDNYYEASKIFHWDEIHNTITVVNSPSHYYYELGGWWIEAENGGECGAWRLPADQPQLAVNPIDNKLYCLWHGNADTADYSAAGYVNGEIYGAKSNDGGITWTDYTNLTNTPSPGADAGDCFDEDYMTVYPIITENFPYVTMYLTYIEDKDAGAAILDGTAWTENPVLCWAPPIIAVQAVIDVAPDVLNLKSRGRWIICYIELPEDYSAGDIDINTIALTAVDNEPIDPPLYREGPTYIGDYDEDDIADLMVKFNRENLMVILIEKIEPPADVELTVSGELTDGTPFEGSDIIHVIHPGGPQTAEQENFPYTFTLYRNHPNPFSSNTDIRYALPTDAQVKLDIYDVSGRVVKTLGNDMIKAGYYVVSWDGTDEKGMELPSGVYFLKFEAGDYTETRKLILLR